MKTAVLALLFANLLIPEAFAALSGPDLLKGTPVEVKPGGKGTVAVFMSARCPCSNSHVGVVKKLARDFKEFNFVVVHSNADESVDVAKAYFENVGFSFPVLADEKGKLADEYRALKTPHAFLFDPSGKILFKGGVTGSADDPVNSRQQYLRDALKDVKDGHDVKVAQALADRLHHHAEPPMRWLLAVLFLSACAERKYLSPAEGTGGDKQQKLERCLARFASHHCASMAWEKMPGESEFGAFLFKTFRPNAADGSAIVEDLGASAAVLLWMPGMGHGSSPVTVERLDTGTYRAKDVFFTMKGEWEIRIQIQDGANVKDQAVIPITL